MCVCTSLCLYVRLFVCMYESLTRLGEWVDGRWFCTILFWRFNAGYNILSR